MKNKETQVTGNALALTGPDELRKELSNVLIKERTYDSLRAKYPDKLLAGVSFVLKRIKGEWCLLFVKRGSGARDNQGNDAMPGGEIEKMKIPAGFIKRAQGRDGNFGN